MFKTVTWTKQTWIKHHNTGPEEAILYIKKTTGKKRHCPFKQKTNKEKKLSFIRIYFGFPGSIDFILCLNFIDKKINIKLQIPENNTFHHNSSLRNDNVLKI